MRIDALICLVGSKDKCLYPNPFKVVIIGLIKILNISSVFYARNNLMCLMIYINFLVSSIIKGGSEMCFIVYKLLSKRMFADEN